MEKWRSQSRVHMNFTRNVFWNGRTWNWRARCADISFQNRESELIPDQPAYLSKLFTLSFLFQAGHTISCHSEGQPLYTVANHPCDNHCSPSLSVEGKIEAVLQLEQAVWLDCQNYIRISNGSVAVFERITNGHTLMIEYIDLCHLENVCSRYRRYKCKSKRFDRPCHGLKNLRIASMQVSKSECLLWHSRSPRCCIQVRSYS
jgi:hypothetical protein